jgi:hypothetical protein
VAVLDPEKVRKSTGSALETLPQRSSPVETPRMRIRKSNSETAEFCSAARGRTRSFVINGIQKSFLANYPEFEASVSLTGSHNVTLVINQGTITCIGTTNTCNSATTAAGDNIQHITLQNGYLTPGLTAVTDSLGIKEVSLDEETGDGAAQVKDEKDPAYIDYAKYGVRLDGKAFARARLGGVTRAITPPEIPLVNDAPVGMLQGVSVGIRTSGTKTILGGGIFQDEVGLHMNIGQPNKYTGSVSMAIKTLRGILADNKNKGNESAYGLVASGQMPLIVEVESKVSSSDVLC